MQKKLCERLNEVNLTEEKILKVVNPKKEEGVILYTSHLDGLGTHSSDFDVYVINYEFEQKPTNGKNYVVETRDFNPDYYGVSEIPYFYLDIECWTINVIENIIAHIREGRYVTDAELKLVWRIHRGEVLKNNILIEKNRMLISQLDIYSYCKNRFAVSSDQELHDCVTLYDDKKYVGAIICGRNALNYAIAGLNAKSGCVNVNVSKWCYSAFQRNKKYFEKYNKLYMKYMFGEGVDWGENKEGFVFEMILLIQDVLNLELDFLGRKHWKNKEKYLMLDESQDVLYEV